MKPACCLSAATLGLALLTAALRADPPEEVGPPDPNAPLNPYMQTDENGTPLAVLNTKLAPLTQEQKDAIREEQEKADFDKDWLIRNYERALQSHSSDHPGGFEKSDLYYELSRNPALAHLAGLPDLGPAPVNPPNSQTPGPPVATTAPVAPDKITGLPHAFQWKPFLSPSSSPQDDVLNPAYGSQPTAMPSPFASSPDSSAPTPWKRSPPRTEKTEDTLDLETPGMTAAKDDPSAGLDTSDLTLDLLPGETVAQAKAERARENSIELPEPMNADQLHQSLMPSAKFPGQTGATNTAAAAPPPPPSAPQVDPEAPTPISQQPVISPVHAPVANPFDILNR